VSARTARDRRRALSRGHLAETLAAVALVAKGYRILARRYLVKGGEIDIIARRGDTIVFVEVKARPTLAEAYCAIDHAKRRRISRAARVWLVANPWAVRFVLRGDAIFIAPWHWPAHGTGAIELELD
jgi:putative endonuclease